MEYNNGIIQRRGRGVFKKTKITPLVGDEVTFEFDKKEEGYILDIDNRKNELRRPPIANVDQAIIVTSVKEPDLSLNLIDKFLVLVEAKQIEPILFITKMDLLSDDEKQDCFKKLDYYKKIGCQVLYLSKHDQNLREQLLPILNHKVSVFAGQSGVGKTTLLNKLIPSLDLETGQISSSLGRGKHTTRHVELIPFEDGLIADTPGFSAIDFSEIELEELPDCFSEFRERRHLCKFRGCHHINEPTCAIKAALQNGEIMEERYENYLQFYEEIKSRKPRY